jgi:hypothetical protein
MTNCRTVLALLGAILLGASNAHAGPLGYTLDVTTSYGFGTPAGNIGAYSGGPDTSFVTITNNGTTTFTGTISDVAVSQFSGDFSQSFAGMTLAPGASVVFTTSPESSNVGGFNGPFGSPQPGITIMLGGLINGTEAVSLSVSDKEIHSGVINGGGVTDAYVLQGGNPTGGDYGDAIETTQAPGHFRFFEAPAGVPEPASLTLLGMGIAGMAGYGWRKRKQA